MVMAVSIAKNNAKITKKLIFSILAFIFPEWSMGYKTAYDSAILMKVTIKNVYPTLSMFLAFT